MPYLMLKEVPRYECLQEAASRMPGTDPSICELFLNLLQTGDVAAQSEAKFLAAHGLNQARVIVLVLLDNSETGGMRSSELAERAKVSRATVTGLLDTMERASLILRAPDPHDRRATTVKITPKGSKLIRRVQPELMTWAQGILSLLSALERKQLVKLLQKTQQAFAVAPSADRKGSHS